jgi:hypothetical protein
MERTAPLRAALEAHFFPHVESTGFIRDKRKEPRITCFRRKTEAAMQIFAIWWERRGRPRFWIQFAESPLSGIDNRGEHVAAEDVLPGNLALLRGWLLPGTGWIWFRLDNKPLWRRLILGQRSNPDEVVNLLVKRFSEVTEWWERKTKGPHLKVFPAINLPPKASHPSVDAGVFSFRYTTAEYRCTKCSNGQSEHAGSLSLPYLIVVFLATIAWSFGLFSEPLSFPWYYFFSIFAGELLLLFVAGFPLTLFKMATGGGSIARPCPSCGAPMTLRGRHFTKSRKPRWTDSVLLLLFAAINVGLWISLFYHV